MSIKTKFFTSILLGTSALGLVACQQSGEADAPVSVAQNGPATAMAPPPGAQGMGPPPGAMGMGPDESSSLVPSSKVTYKSVDGKDLQLHIFNPVGHKASDKSPALIFYHGGGFRQGNPQAGYDLSEALNPKGIVVIAAQYRLIDSDERTLDDIMADAKSSVRYVRANADKLGIGPNKIVASGHSAGAYLSYTVGAIDGFDEPGEDTSVSAMANAMILWSMGPARAERNTGAIVANGRRLDDYQPAKYLDGDFPPSLFIHGDIDTLIAPGPTQAFEKTVAAAGNQSEFVLIEGADHFFRSKAQRDQAKTAIIDFFTSIGFTD